MTNSHLIFSVVVCVYNGADQVARTIRSLERLDYPRADYEIVVVDDGSTDATAKVLTEFSAIRVVAHEKNKGHSAARNTGFQTTRGRYVAYIDADCVAHPLWLTELEKALKQPGTLAVGGQIAALSQKYIAQRYLIRSGYGRPAALQLGRTKTLWQRLTAYVRDKFHHAAVSQLKAGEVCEVYGANAAFDRAKLRAVGGFPTDIRSSEDAAICQRLRQNYPDQAIRFNPRAAVRHDFAPTFGVYLRELFYRQADNLIYYRSLHKAPPIFPFPFAILAGVLLAGLVHPWLAIVALLVLPLAVYSWWILTAIKRRSLEALVYAYMQFLDETARDGGLIVAALRGARRPHPHIFLIVLLLVASLIGVHVGQIAWLGLPTAILSIVVPGYLLMCAFGLRRFLAAPFKRLVFMVLLGVLWNTVVGLMAATLLPLGGDGRPLEPQAVLGVYAIGLGPVVFAALLRRPQPLPARKFTGGFDVIILWIVAMALPFAAVVGANLLNRGSTNKVALITLLVGALLFMITAWRAKRLPASTMPLVLFCVGVAALLSYTLRSSYLFGWDIQQEFEVFLQTFNSAQWVLGQVHNPYDAMLSLTILPNVLAGLSGLSGQDIFKVLFPVLFSLVPVILYYIYRLWANRAVAFVAAGVFIAQFYYLQEFAALARQQIAFLFFAGLLYVLLQTTLRGARRVLLIVALIFGMVVSHYSTTYMAIGLLAGTFVLAKLFFAVRGRGWLRLEAHVVPLWVVLVMLAGAWAWYGPATHSSSLFGSSQQAANRNGGDTRTIFTRIASEVEGTLNGEKGPAANVDAGVYLQNIGRDYRRDRGYMSYYPGASNHDIQPVASRSVPAKGPGLLAVSNLADTILRYAWWIFGTLGLLAGLAIAWRRRALRNGETVMMGAMALIAFVVIHIAPSIGQFYNIPRLNQQALMFVALPAIMLLAWLVRKTLPKLERAAIVLPLTVAFLIASGVMAQLVGGRPHANLNNYGVDYQHFYIHDSEVAAAKWLEADRGVRRDVIYADRYANLRLAVPTTINGHVMSDITPETLAKYAYVYATQTNIVDGATMSSYKEKTITVQFPRGFIEANKSTLYSNDFTKVYK
ncbi:MAG TPA: glycosyltransferase [Candidatus Saccharimonadales bacterium]